jgi:hypothetical protein
LSSLQEAFFSTLLDKNARCVFLREKVDVIRNDRVNEDCSVSSLIARRRSIGRDIEHSFDHSNRRCGRLAGPYTASSGKRANPIVIN